MAVSAMGWRRYSNVGLFSSAAAALLTSITFFHLDLGPTPRAVGPLFWVVAATVLLIITNWGEVARVVASRRAVMAAVFAVNILLGLGVAVAVNLMAERHYYSFDWTLKSLYTLSERTENVLENLPKKVTAHVIGSPTHDLYVTVRSTLDMYRAAAKGKLEVEYVDPLQDRERLTRALAAIGVDAKQLDDPNVVIFAAETGVSDVPRTKHIPFRDVVEVDYSMGGPRGGQLKGFKAEELFTEAILTVARDRQSAAYLLTGHQELEAYGGRGGEDERIGRFEQTLKRLSYKVESFAFEFGPDSTRQDVPADCDVLIIAGPKTRFEDREIERLEAYLERGGRILVLADPVLRPRPGTRSVFFEETRLDLLLKEYGLETVPSYVYDPTATVMDFAFAPPVEGIAENHSITKPIAGLKLLFNTAQAVRTLAPGDVAPDVRTQAILETSARAIAVRDMDAVQRTGNPFTADHLKGPIVLAAVASREVMPPTPTADAAPLGTGKHEARIVLVGDASLASDDAVDAMPPNVDFLVNAVSWLAAREEAIAIGAKAPDIVRLRLEEDQKTRVRLLAFLDLPLLCALIGLCVFLVRRS